MDGLDDQEVQSYFEKYIKLYPIQDEPLQVHQVTIEGDSFFINLSINREFETVEQLSVSHFFELFSSQKNILKLSLGDQKRYYTFKSADQIEDLSDLRP